VTRSAATTLGVLAVVLGGMAALGLGGSATETISWSARPTVVRWNEEVTATGQLASGRQDALVTIQTRPCNQETWQDLAETPSTAGGAFSVDFLTHIGGLVRASSGGATSEPVTVQQRPYVFFSQRRPGRFRAGVQAYLPFWHRKMRIERFDTKRRAWLLVKRVLLADTEGGGGQPDIASTTGIFRLDVAKGTTLHATFPLSQAKPCYLAGYSAILRR
jgi:hypothetical protein